MNLFVYGTLRRGASRYDQIASLVYDECEAFIDARLFVLPDGEPILVEGEPCYPVAGELLTLADSPVILQRLDEIEGVRDPDSPYHRVQRRVQSARGDDLAWVYLCRSEAMGEVVLGGHELYDGDWLRHRAR